MEKLKILKQMSTAFQAKTTPIPDSDSNFGAQVAEELRSIKNTVIKTRVKRKIMNDLYEALENDEAQTSTSYQHPPTYPLHTQPYHMNTPVPATQLHNQYQIQNTPTHSFRRMLEEDDD